MSTRTGFEAVHTALYTGFNILCGKIEITLSTQKGLMFLKSQSWTYILSTSKKYLLLFSYLGGIFKRVRSSASAIKHQEKHQTQGWYASFKPFNFIVLEASCAQSRIHGTVTVLSNHHLK